jgi:hypothetical protein
VHEGTTEQKYFKKTKKNVVDICFRKKRLKKDTGAVPVTRISLG